MAALSDAKRDELRRSTFESAIALAEDLQRLRRQVSDPDLTAADVRAMSPILRRILVENDLSAIAAPRIGRLLLLGPDNNPYYRHNRNFPFKYFHSLGHKRPDFTFGASVILWRPPNTLLLPDYALRPYEDIKGVDPSTVHQTVELRLDTFLTQKVICVDNVWASRAACIKFIANQKFGVHSGTTSDGDEDAILSRAMAIMRISLNFLEPKTMFVFSKQAMEGDYRRSAVPLPGTVDVVSAEVLAAAYFLTLSPDVQRLEGEIAREKQFSTQRF